MVMVRKIRDGYRHLRANGYLRGSVIVPLLLVLSFVAVFCWGFYLTGQYDVQTPLFDAHGQPVHTSSGFTQRLWATLGLFTGAYTSLDPAWDPMPPWDISAAGVLALLLTLVAAGSLVLISRRVRDFIGIIRPRTRLVVIGGGRTAAALVSSSIDRRIPTVLITDSRESKAALATKPSIPIIAAGQIESVLSTPSARRVISNAQHVVVATDEDGVNVQLHALIHQIRKRQQKPTPDEEQTIRHGGTERDLTPGQPVPKDLVVLHDPEYAELVCPRTIHGLLPNREVTCPAENVAEHICHLIVAAATGGAGVSRINVEVIEVETGDSNGLRGLSAPLLKPTIDTWVQRLSWVLDIVRGAEGRDKNGNATYQRVPVVVQDPKLAELRIEILTGAAASAVAKRAFADSDPAVLRIVVANEPLLMYAADLRGPSSTDPEVVPGRDWLDDGAPMADTNRAGRPLMLVVDPEKVGLDAGLVTDDTGTQWARTFDVTYGLMYSNGNFSVTGWQPNAPMGDSTTQYVAAALGALGKGASRDERTAAARKARKEISNRYSSKLAVEHMLRLLTQLGYQLQYCDGRPPVVEFTTEEIEFIAEHEHHNWLQRTWYDTSRRWPRRPKLEHIVEYSRSGASKYCYQGLKELENIEPLPEGVDEPGRYLANYNRRIAMETYPAIAASFGYAIVKSGARAAAADKPKPCRRPECGCVDAKKHRGERAKAIPEKATP